METLRPALDRRGAPGRDLRAGRLRAVDHLRRPAGAERGARGLPHAGRHDDVLAVHGLGLPPWAALSAVFPVFFFAGLAVERGLIRPISGMPHHEFLVASILITLGVALAIEDVTAFALTQPVKGIDYLLPPIRLGRLVISSLRLILLGIIVALTAGLHLFLHRSFTGKALRAVMEDREGAILAGIDIQPGLRHRLRPGHRPDRDRRGLLRGPDPGGASHRAPADAQVPGHHRPRRSREPPGRPAGRRARALGVPRLLLRGRRVVAHRGLLRPDRRSCSSGRGDCSGEPPGA